ncbi:MAG: nuclear transport factor 2 family protein [Gemmatimonadales bacterium]
MATAMAGVPAHAQTAADTAPLVQLEHDIGDANIRRDRAFFERVEADEFLFTGSDGSLTTKREDVGGLDQIPMVTLTTWVVDSMRVKRYGSTAIVWGLITTGGRRRDDTAFSHRSRFTDVFVFRDERWQLVAGHSSGVANSH